jgi:hypothetical protein
MGLADFIFEANTSNSSSRGSVEYSTVIPIRWPEVIEAATSLQNAAIASFGRDVMTASNVERPTYQQNHNVSFNHNVATEPNTPTAPQVIHQPNPNAYQSATPERVETSVSTSPIQAAINQPAINTVANSENDAFLRDRYINYLATPEPLPNSTTATNSPQASTSNTATNFQTPVFEAQEKVREAFLQ